MAIAARTATKGTAASGAAFTITFPTSSAAGDVIVLFVANAGTAGPAAPVGWTRYRNADSAGTGQSITTFTAPWSAGLTANFTNASSVASWACNAYSGGNAVAMTDGAGAASSNTTNNTSIPVGNPTTGAVAGDYEVLGYAWTSAATLTAATGTTIEATQANGTAVSVSLGHNNTIPLGASATPTLGNGTLSASNTRKTGVGVFVQALNPQTATPGILSLTIATFAPSVPIGTIVTPGVVALTTAGLAPTVSVSNNQRPTPPTLALTTATFAPTISTTANQTATPGVLALALSTFAPVVTASNHQLVTPTTKALTTTGLAPVVTASNHQTVIPPVAVLTLTPFAPTVTASGGSAVTVTPGTAGLTISSLAPTVSVASAAFVPSGISVRAKGPERPQPVLVTPSPLAMTFRTYAPSVVVNDDAVAIEVLLGVT